MPPSSFKCLILYCAGADAGAGVGAGAEAGAGTGTDTGAGAGEGMSTDISMIYVPFILFACSKKFDYTIAR